MKKIYMNIILLLTLFGCGCSGNNNFLGLGEKELLVEVVENQKNEESIKYNSIFNYEPGTIFNLKSMNGSIDSVGTELKDDYDGDGLVNSIETTSNVWIADYPEIEASIAPAVTMKIEVASSEDSQSTIIESDIDSSDVISNNEFASDSIHRNELNLRTVQFEDSFEQTSSTKKEKNESKSIGGGLSIMSMGTGGGSNNKDKSTGSNNGGNSGGIFGGTFSYSKSSSVSTAFSSEYGETKTKWKDQPFKNNLERNGWALNKNEASKKARNLRNELTKNFSQNKKICSNSGYVRASLYLTNHSINMPVKLSNILCSLMLETPDGQLLPVQSFRLRNQDYSLFEVDLYGGDTFGPYVIELKNLNTNEIKEAILKGYNPKIFIIDYDMVHVDDSNYSQVLANGIGCENLKIIEENAKGRTAGIKIIGRGFRDFFRVVAFDTDGIENRSGSVGIKNITPGVSLEKTLSRISYSGTKIEMANYVLDFSGLDNEMHIKNPQGGYYSKPAFFMRGIKSINGIETKLPIDKDHTISESDGSTTYIIKPINEWTEQEKLECRIWVVYDSGRYYSSAADLYKKVDNQNVRCEYPYNGINIPKIQGINGIIWPGDHYDIVYLDIGEYLGLINNFGNTPIETGEILKFNTRWNYYDVFDYTSYKNNNGNPFEADKHSQYLGEAHLGDEIEINIKLDSTYYLNPDFGAPKDFNGDLVYDSFRYNWKKENKKFEYEDAIDMEISYSLGNRYSDWVNINSIRNPSCRASKLKIDKPVWDFSKQTFTAKVTIPSDLTGVGSDGIVKLYLRTALNNAYADYFWPVSSNNNTKLYKFFITAPVRQGDNHVHINSYINISNYYSDISVQSSNLKVQFDGDPKQYNVMYDNDTYRGSGYSAVINVNPTITGNYNIGESILLSITPKDGIVNPYVVTSKEYANEWNMVYNNEIDDNINDYSLLDDGNKYNSLNLGFNTPKIISNWIGFKNFGNPNFLNKWNAWYYEDIPYVYNYSPLSMINKANSDLNLNYNELPLVDGSIDMAVYKDDVLVISSNSGMTYGEHYNLNTKRIVGNKINITDNSYGKLKVFEFGELGFFYWTGSASYARLFNMKTFSFSSDQFAVNSSGSQKFIEAVSNGSKIFIVGTLKSDNFLYGQIIDINTRSVSEIKISTIVTTYSDLRDCKVIIKGNNALVSWHSGSGTSPINYRIIDISNGTYVTNQIQLSGTDNIFGIEHQYIKLLYVNNDVVLYNGTCVKIDMLNGTSTPFASNVQLNNQNCYIYGDKVITFYFNKNKLYGRITDILTGKIMDPDFLIADSYWGTGYTVKITPISGSKFLLTWFGSIRPNFYYSKNRSTNITEAYYGKVIDINDTTALSKSSVFGISGGVNQCDYQIKYSNGKAVLIFTNEGNHVYYHKYLRFIDTFSNFSVYGIRERSSLIFPLIERNYSVTTNFVAQ